LGEEPGRLPESAIQNLAFQPATEAIRAPPPSRRRSRINFHNNGGIVAGVHLLIAKRAAAGLTQAELAARIGEYQSFVAGLESGQRRDDVVEFIDLAEKLGFDPAKAISNLRKTT
jgi:ribosome-binding protein aMBF1 (putative translation factor)